MYGALTGKSKQMIANEYGEDQLKVRRFLCTLFEGWTTRMLTLSILNQTLEEMAPWLQDPAAASVVVLAELPRERLQTDQVRQGHSRLADGDDQPQHRGEEVPSAPKVSQDGEPVGLHAAVDSVLHGQDRARGREQGEARPHHQPRERDPRHPHAPVRYSRGGDEPAAPAERPSLGESLPVAFDIKEHGSCSDV